VPRSGATIIGARYPLISFTATLNTSDSEIAHAISRSVHYNEGGFKHVKTYVASLPDNHLAQIWVNLSNYRETPMYRVIEMLRVEARRYGLAITRVDMIGLIPEQALIESAQYYMNVNDFSADKLLEKNIQKHLDESIT
jgi:glutamate formiminotransferase / 5-formyltetrahydrofolate cyclo-ligase